jgi:hypothetical protein
MAQTMTRPARDNSQKAGDSREVKRTVSTFGTFRRYTEIQLDQMTPEQRTGYDFEVKERGEVPGPHKIWLQNSKLLEIMIPVKELRQRREVQSYSSTLLENGVGSTST